MTGYARAQGQDAFLAWMWEIKSVNGRGLEVRTRVPPGYDLLDSAVRDAIQRLFQRGNLSISLAVKPVQTETRHTVDEALLEQLVALARRWRDKAPDLAPASIDGLLALKGVLDGAEAEEADDANAVEARQNAMLVSLHDAAKALGAMRAAEGERLGRVLRALLDEIETLVGSAEGLACLGPDAVRDRLRQQVQLLLDAVPSFSEERLAQEAALIAAKADVREELDRLRAHLAAARDLLAGGNAIGRKLDFLCQEFNREAKTLCSKANDVALTKIGLSLKAAIEQFREQVQNIE